MIVSRGAGRRWIWPRLQRDPAGPGGSIPGGPGRRIRREIAGIAAPLAGVSLITWLIGGLAIAETVDNVAMLYLIVIVAAAAIFGRISAIVASIAAVGLYHWFFVNPTQSLDFTHPTDLFALAVFLAVGLVTGELASALRAQAAQARLRETEALALFRLTRAVSAADGAAAIRQAVVDQARESFGAAAAALIATAESGEQLLLARSGDPLPDADLVMPPGDPEAGPRGGQAFHFRRAGREPRHPTGRLPLGSHGSLLLVWSPDGEPALPEANARIWRAFRDQAGLALERAWLTEETRHLERLRQREVFQTTLLSMVSHDLRTPLASIKTLASDLDDPALHADAATRREIIGAIDRETDRLTRLVSNLLDLSRLEAGVLNPRKDWYAVDELVREVVDRFSVRSPRVPVEVRVVGLPGPVELDDVQIDQVLSNLLDNAARFSPPDRPIEVVVAPEEGAIRVDVLDRGPGIAPADRDHVFERFFRGRDSRAPGGLGLGLAICRGLIEAHGGAIWAADRPSGGAQFSFRLPAPLGIAARRESLEAVS